MSVWCISYKGLHRNMDNMNENSYKFIDLFAGIGGLRLGFETQGANCVFSSEWDSDAQKTYEANFGEKPAGDITKISAETIPEFDILLAGFPCQPFSSMGLRQGFKDKIQGTLFFEICRIIEEKNPPVVFLENVPGLLTHNEGNTFKVVIESLEKLGYKVYSKVLNASDFGVPQNRKRVYIIAFNVNYFGGENNILFDFPKPSKKEVGIGQFIEKNVKGYTISEHLQKSYLFKKEDGKPEIVDKSTKKPVKTLVSTYHKIQRLTGTFVKDGETGLRLLSQKECKYIMGFPEDFKFPVSRTQMYRQLGNAVVVPVIQAIAKEVIKTVNKESRKDMPRQQILVN